MPHCPEYCHVLTLDATTKFVSTQKSEYLQRCMFRYVLAVLGESLFELFDALFFLH
jgi:hypothetical protein